VLERGLRPIVELLAAERDKQQEVNREGVAVVVGVLVRHMADHPHLARLLERAMLEETGSVQALIARWLAPLYRGAAAVVETLAPESGWEPDEVPHVWQIFAGILPEGQQAIDRAGAFLRRRLG